LREQQEAERKRKEEEQRRLEEVRRAEQARYQQQLEQQRREQQQREQREREEHARQLREQQQREQQQREAHERQLRQNQISSLNALKNEKLVQKRAILDSQLSPLRAEICDMKQQIVSEEKEIQKFEAERNDVTHKMLLLIGKTKAGKSTFGNRLMDDVSMLADAGDYKTSGDSKSCTKVLQKSVHNKLSIIDCPGWADTDGQDRTHTNNLCQFLRGCGGINAIVVVRNGTDCGFDAHFQSQLKELESVFGVGFWRHLILVLTHIDKGMAEYQFNKDNKAQQMKQDVSAFCNGVNENVAVIPIGLDNYEEKLAQFKDAIPTTRYQCDSIKSPIDDLKAQLQGLLARENEVNQRVVAIDGEIRNIDTQISNLNRNL